MQPFLALITPLSGAPVEPPPSGAHPAHPIWRPDLGFWGGSSPGVMPQPPSGAHPSHPIVLPGTPEHPIYYPPEVAAPPVDPGYGVDVGTGPVRPTHPIVIPKPPSKPPAQGGVPIHLPAQDPSAGGWVYAYVPGYGWMWIQVAPDPVPPPITAVPPSGNVGPAHPIQPTVPQPKK